MLVLTRKAGESIVINNDIHVVVVSMDGNKCRLGVVAPPAVPVHRREVYEKLKARSEGSEPCGTPRGELPETPLEGRVTLAFTGATTGDNSLAAELEAGNAGYGG